MTVAEAIVALRKALRKTQQELAHMLDVSVSAIYKYEAGRVPEPGILYRLKAIAEDAHQEELSILFRRQVYEDIGVPDSWKGALPLEPNNDFEKALVAGVLATFRSRVLEHRRAPVLNALQESCLAVKEKIKQHQIRLSYKRMIDQMQKLAEKNGTGYYNQEKRRLVFYQKNDDPAAIKKDAAPDQTPSNQEVVAEPEPEPANV